MRNLGWGLFPNLRTVDFSYNKIKQFSFADKRMNKTGYVHINLRGNLLSSLEKDTVENMFSQNKLLIDIRENFIACDCSTTFMDTLKTLNTYKTINIRDSSYYGYLWDLDCSPNSDVVMQNRNATLKEFYISYYDFCRASETSLSNVGTITKPDLIDVLTVYIIFQLVQLSIQVFECCF